MARQLVLLDQPPDGRLDDTTRATGRRGLATARAALAASHRTYAAGTPDSPPPAAA